MGTLIESSILGASIGGTVTLAKDNAAKKAGEKPSGYGRGTLIASAVVAGTTTAGATANYHDYNNIGMHAYAAEKTRAAYVEQLSDEELASKLEEFGMLPASDTVNQKNSIKK